MTKKTGALIRLKQTNACCILTSGTQTHQPCPATSMHQEHVVGLLVAQEDIGVAAHLDVAPDSSSAWVPVSTRTDNVRNKTNSTLLHECGSRGQHSGREV